jgi:cell division protein FtsB
VTETRKNYWWQSLSQGAIRLILVAAAIFLGVNLVRSVEHNYAISRQIRTLNGQIATEELRAAVLKDQIQYYQTDTFKELETRRRLGYVKPGESVVLVPENRDPTSAAVAGTPAASESEARTSWNDTPPYEQWWLLFFGPQSLLEAVFSS